MSKKRKKILLESLRTASRTSTHPVVPIRDQRGRRMYHVSLTRFSGSFSFFPRSTRLLCTIWHTRPRYMYTPILFSRANKKNTSRLQWADFFFFFIIWDPRVTLVPDWQRQTRSFHCCQKNRPKIVREEDSKRVARPFLRTGVCARAFTFTLLSCRRERLRVFPRQRIFTREKKRSTRCEQRGATPVLRSR